LRVLWITPLFQLKPIKGRVGPIEVCTRLSRRGHEVKVLCMNPDGLKASDNIDDVQVLRLPTTTFRYASYRYYTPYPWALATIIREVRSFGPDAINFHTYEYPTSIFTFLARKIGAISSNVPLVATLDSFPGLMPNERYGSFLIDGALRAYSPSLGRAVVDMADKVILTSKQHLIGAMRMGIDLDKIVLIRWGIDIHRFRFSPENRKAVREELGISDDEVVVGFIGRMTYAKGIPFLVKSLRKVLPRRPEVRAVFIGDGPMRPLVEELIREFRERVLFLGWRYDVDRLMSALDICVLPSLIEAVGVSALEACANGRAVITTDIGGFRDYIIHMRTGVLIPPADHIKLVEAIEMLVDNPGLREELGRNASSFVSSFDWEKTADKYERLYGELLRA